jgi:hypothetical protein
MQKQKQKERKRRLLLTYCLSLTGLSQACLGKMVVFGIKMARKKRGV